jgi:hypothetical protein
MVLGSSEGGPDIDGYQCHYGDRGDPTKEHQHFGKPVNLGGGESPQPAQQPDLSNHEISDTAVPGVGGGLSCLCCALRAL